MLPGYDVHIESPTVAEYLELRQVAGLSPFAREAARRGLAGSLHAVVVRTSADGKAVGMGRLVGDGGCFVQVVDIAVAPEHQGRGLGKRIVQSLMEYVASELPSTVYVSLLADGEAPRLYQKYGFEPTAPASIGMAYRKRG
jgi:ribosomal protein S18 acetylase RimI-like enzyme